MAEKVGLNMAIAGDRVPLHGGRHVQANFLGHAACFPQGPWLLAGLLKCPVNLLFCLKSTPEAIDAFIDEHPLTEDVKLIDAPFWTPQQAAFLKEELRDDAEWAIAVDELNQRLHQPR